GSGSGSGREKAAYAALATILQNEASRTELINPLHSASESNAKPNDPVLAFPEEDNKTVLKSVTDVSR
ncbi:MAG TPA: hypothetical protein DEF05_02010, partial [Erwinia sp.]|nr:hypothetical protein [Erwinia sp.]